MTVYKSDPMSTRLKEGILSQQINVISQPHH